MDPQPRLYSDIAGWWPLLSAPADYEEEAAFYTDLIVAQATHPVTHVLELGSGGGNNASHMKARFDLTLVDRSTAMLDVSRALNPECEHLGGDMRTVRLGREFDAVFVHDAICYMTTAADLRLAVATATVHCRPGGVVLLAPDHTRENFVSATDHGGHDGSGRAVRYLAWTWDPDPDDTTYVADYVYALRTGTGPPRVVTDRHVEGLFPRALWLDTLADAGLEPAAVPFDHSEVVYGLEVFVGRKPTAG